MRKSRAKKKSDGQIAAAELCIAQDDGPYRDDVRPRVNRKKLLEAVDYPYADQWLMMWSGSHITPDQEARWSKLMRIRAAIRELSSWADKLGGIEPAADDPRSAPVTKEALFIAVHGKKPENTAQASRWYKDKVAPVCDPVPRNPAMRGKVTVNLLLFAERFGPEAADAVKDSSTK